MARSRTRSRPLAHELSPEVQWYLETRGYELPKIVPRVRTPEPRNVRGAVFDAEEVDAKIQALGYLRHTKGRWAGRPLVPNNVQVAFIIAPIFGWRVEVADWERGSEECTEPLWKRAALRRAGWSQVPDSVRRVRIIREAYVEMPRKGAKTTLVSGLAMLLAFADGEGGAEVLVPGARQRRRDVGEPGAAQPARHQRRRTAARRRCAWYQGRGYGWRWPARYRRLVRFRRPPQRPAWHCQGRLH